MALVVTSSYNAMQPDQISLATWAPTDRQARLAEYLAAGYSLRRACEVTGIPYTTAYPWWYSPGIPGYHEYVRQLRDQHTATYQNRFDAIISLALDIDLQVLTGECSPDDPRAIRAADILGRTGYRIAAGRALRERPVEPGKRQPGDIPEPPKQLN